MPTTIAAIEPGCFSSDCELGARWWKEFEHYECLQHSNWKPQAMPFLTVEVVTVQVTPQGFVEVFFAYTNP